MRVAVIGAGPSGLVTLKYLLAAHDTLKTDQPIEVRCFESESDVGGTFLARVYEDAELVSSRQLTSFSDFRCDDDEPDFLSAARYVDYLRGYCDRFQLWPHISFGCTVRNVERRRREENNNEQGNSNAGYCLLYEVTSSDGQKKPEQHRWDCDAIAVCSGLHVNPSIPHLVGVDKIPIRLHSSELKRREQFGRDTTVLVVGSGETGADVAHLAVTSPTKRVILSHRDGFHLAPKRNPRPKLIFSRPRHPETDKPQLPIDVSRASLFDTTYVHPWLRNSNLLWDYYTLYLKLISWVSWGTPHGHNQWVGEKPEGWSSSEIFFNKAGHKISPHMAAKWQPKTVPPGLLNYLRSWVVLQDAREDEDQGKSHDTTIKNSYMQQKQTKKTQPSRTIDVAPWPERIDDSGVVHFRNNGRPEYQAIMQEYYCSNQHYNGDSSTVAVDLEKKEKEATVSTTTGGVKPDIIVFCTGYRREFPFLAGLKRRPRDTPMNGNNHYHHNDSSAPRGGGGENEEQQETEGVGNPNVRSIWNRSEPTIGFIGFIRPNLGAIPPLAEMQAQLWVLNLVVSANTTTGTNTNGTTSTVASPSPSALGHIPLTPLNLHREDEAHYRLHNPNLRKSNPKTKTMKPRIDYGVDHESYMYQLALDMGSAPSFVEVLRMAWGASSASPPAPPPSSLSSSYSSKNWWRLPITYFMTAHMTPKFRLCGPWKWEAEAEAAEGHRVGGGSVSNNYNNNSNANGGGALEVMVGDEVWDTFARREIFFGHITLSLIPMVIFGTLSLLTYILALLVGLLAPGSWRKQATGKQTFHSR